MKYFLILFLLLSFGVKGQDKIIKSQFPPMGYWAGDTSVKPIFLGEPQLWVSDTPQADRNPNDFYVDSAWHITGTKITGELGSMDSISHVKSTLIIDPYSYDNKGRVYKNGKLYGIKAKHLSLEEKLLQYASECWNDTLVLTKIPELPDDYIIEHPHYREVLTEAQLKKQGYEYQHRFLETEYVDGEYKAVGWKYYFVKIPTLAGFAEYLKKK